MRNADSKVDRMIDTCNRSYSREEATNHGASSVEFIQTGPTDVARSRNGDGVVLLRAGRIRSSDRSVSQAEAKNVGNANKKTTIK